MEINLSLTFCSSEIISKIGSKTPLMCPTSTSKTNYIIRMDTIHLS